MSSIKKTFTVIIATIIVVGFVFGVAKQFEVEESSVLDQLEFDAVYLKDENIVQISFEDKSNNTKSVILEVLGMDVTYHQVYLFDGESGFVENIPDLPFKDALVRITGPMHSVRLHQFIDVKSVFPRHDLLPI